MSTIIHQLNVCRAVAIATFKEWSVYRTHTLVSVFVGPVYFAVQYFIWTAVYGAGAQLGGMDLDSMIRYFGATALIGYLTMNFADWNLGMLVRSGKFLTFALRPIHHRFFALSQKIGHRALGLVLEFLPCLLIIHFLFGVDMRPASIPWALLSVSLAFLVNFYFNYILGLVSFWFVRVDGVRSIIHFFFGILSGAFFPLVLFPGWLQQVMFFLPFQYAVFVPGMVYVGQFTPIMVGYQAVAVLVLYAVSEFVYRRAMRHFCDVGA